MIVDFHVRKYLEMPLNIDIAEEKYLTVFFCCCFFIHIKHILSISQQWLRNGTFFTQSVNDD